MSYFLVEWRAKDCILERERKKERERERERVSEKKNSFLN